MNDKLNQTLRLRDGRALGFAEYGPTDGAPVFYFHGHPSSRLDWALFDPNDMVTQLGIHLVAPDRPGHGLSTHQLRRTLLDWPDDVIQLANTLGLETFAILGISGGGPFAEACAFKIPHRVIKTGIVCGMGPAHAAGAREGLSWTYAGKPRLVRSIMLKMMALGLRRNPQEFQRRFLSQANASFSAPDGRLLEDNEFANSFLELTFGEALRQGVNGASHDAKLYARPWGFDLEAIPGEVYLWHGEQDTQVLPSIGRHVAEAIPNCHATFLKDEGHLSLPRNSLRDILSTLVS